MGRIQWSDVAEASYPAGVSSPRTKLNSVDGKLDAFGTVVPANGSTGFAKGCNFQNTSDGKVYVNKGSKTSSSFQELQTGAAASGSAAGRGPSPAIWDSCPVQDFNLNMTDGWEYSNDFIAQGVVLAANQAATQMGDVGAYTAATAATIITTLTTAREGVVKLETTTDDEGATMSLLQGRHTTGQVTFEAGKETWFEARVQLSSITDTELNTYIGFASEGLLTAAALLSTGNALTDVDSVCFAQLAANGDAWQTSHNTAGGGGVTPISATAGVAAATTYYKLGIYCDGTSVYFFIDGVQLADSVLLTATNFPDGEEMAFYFAIMAASGTAVSAQIDWLRVAQQF